MTGPKLHLVVLSPDDAAAAWLARQDASPQAAEHPDFIAWLAASDLNRQAWSRAQTLWADAAHPVAEDPLLSALRADALAARPDPWPKLAIAACLVAAIGGGFLAWRLQNSPVAEPSGQRVAVADPTTRYGAVDLVSTKGGRLVTRLPDGTRLELDTDSAVDLAFTARERRLRLVRGQAFVTVAADPRRPFALDIADQTIVDRGTAFAARLDPAGIRVTLLQGRVAVGPTGTPPRYDLTPGQRLTLNHGRPGVVETVDTDQALAWRQGFVEFSNTPLGEAVAEMNRYGGQTLIVRDPRVASLKASGRFKLGDAERFVRTTSALLPIHATRVAEGLELRAGGEPSEPAR